MANLTFLAMAKAESQDLQGAAEVVRMAGKIHQ
jgi:hypothetical protein